MLKCREVVHDTDRLLEGDLRWHQRLSMRMHLAMCRHCRRYVNQFKRLLRAVPGLHRQATDEEIRQILEAIHQAEGTSGQPDPAGQRPR